MTRNPLADDLGDIRSLGGDEGFWQKSPTEWQKLLPSIGQDIGMMSALASCFDTSAS